MNATQRLALMVFIRRNDAELAQAFLSIAASNPAVALSAVKKLTGEVIPDTAKYVKIAGLTIPETVYAELVRMAQEYNASNKTDNYRYGLVTAIKYLRGKTLLGLKDAKDVCDVIYYTAK